MDADDFLEGSAPSTPALISKIQTLPGCKEVFDSVVEKHIHMTRGVVICGYNLDTPGITLAGGRSGA